MLLPMVWGALRFRRVRVAGLIRTRAPVAARYPEFSELVERGAVPAGWTPVRDLSTKSVPFVFVWCAAIVLPWFWGPLFGLALGDVMLGVFVAAMLSLP